MQYLRTLETIEPTPVFFEATLLSNPEYRVQANNDVAGWTQIEMEFEDGTTRRGAVLASAGSPSEGERVLVNLHHVVWNSPAYS